MKTALSVCFAIGAAALFGLASVLQQAAAQEEHDLPIVGLRVLGRLARRRKWLLAVAMAGLSFGVQAVALAFGPIALVQPLASTDLLFALPLLARRQRLSPRARDWGAAALVVAGVSGFLAASPPTAGSTTLSFGVWVPLIVGAGAVVTVAVTTGLILRGTARTALLAGGAAVAFAMVDVLTKASVGVLAARGVAVLWSWEPYALLVTGVSGMALAQGAYRAGSLLTSLPIIDTVEPIGAVVVGATVFGEHLGGSPLVWAAQLGAGALAVVGIVMLDRSPLLRASERFPSGASTPTTSAEGRAHTGRPASPPGVHEHGPAPAKVADAAASDGARDP